MIRMRVGMKVRILNDAPGLAGEFFYRKGDVGTVTKVSRNTVMLDFNGIADQSVTDDGKWLAPHCECEVVE